MQKLKLMTIVGTRPEIIKLSEVIKKANIHFNHVLVHTGQNYDFELNEIFFNELDIPKPQRYLNVSDENVGHTIGNIISKSFDIMKDLMPDALLILGDTNSCLSVISAKRLKIPVFHLEAGNRCFDENLPEEVIRRIVDHTSDVNMCFSEHARRYLYSEGINKERTFVVGSPMREILNLNINKIFSSDILDRLKITKKQYILLSSHREENIDNEKNFFELMEAINILAEKHKMPIIYSAHPRSRKFIASREFIFNEQVKIYKPFGFFDYNNLQMNAFCVVSDSGTLAEESSYFKFPAVSIRTSTERPEALEKGCFILGTISSTSLIQAVEIATNSLGSLYNSDEQNAYLETNVSSNVIKIIQSYTNIINRTVWRK
jgi:UDP-N-acetylglucosamine 2-epimerase (non-hydrolysing)